ncbi:inorganic triphosphatase [Parasalinivibrio latis]|uniref:CYTH and CHAD domain-containing protein n=1 Tax=Parasalinivibrio latis TaxID=2952610 RepID=UPI0030E3E58E
METEIELKFFVSPHISLQIRDKIAEYKVLQQGQRFLNNTYYDTPDLQLRMNDIGLRVRRYDDVFVQTMKTAGRVVAGLHQRPEYNAELENATTPDLHLVPHEALPEGVDIDTLQAQLKPLFATDFERQQWLIAMADGSQIELALDQGNVTTDDGGEDVISEVELELKSGQTDALFTLARDLAEFGGVRLGNLSKAARGYRLATGYQGDKPFPLKKVPVNTDMSVEQAFVCAIEHALSHWQYHEQVYFESGDATALYEISLSVALVRQSLALYGGMIPRRASALLRQELQWLEGELDWLPEARAIAQLVEDKGYYLRKLNAKKPLRKALEARDELLPDMAEVQELLESPRYCKLLLDLSRWMLTRGWQPFLDEKSQTKLAAPVLKFAVRQLDISWEELRGVFNRDEPLSRQEYFDQHAKLTRNLLTGVCLANLFDQERCNAFRLPWLDVFQGIDDLELLEPVRKLEKEFDEEDNAQIQKWLARKEESLIHAMTQSQMAGLDLEPYWID